MTKKHISERDFSGYFWYGLPADLRVVFEGKLQMKYPLHDTAEPWQISYITAVAEEYFKRDKFSDMLLHAEPFGYGHDTDDCDSGTESDSESDSEYSDDSDKRHRRRHHRHHKYKKIKSKKNQADKTRPPNEDNRSRRPQTLGAGFYMLWTNI